MKINSYSKFQANTIRQIDSTQNVSDISRGNDRIERVEAVKYVTPGFNATTLYLFKLAKHLKENSKFKGKNKKFKDMTFEEFTEYIFSISDDVLDDDEHLERNMKDEQLLFLQDILSAIEDGKEKENSSKPIVIVDDIANMELYEFRKFLITHREIFSQSGFFHYEIGDIKDISDKKLLEIKRMVVRKIIEIHDLFYYNKAFSEYEKTYNNIADINSNGLNA